MNFFTFWSPLFLVQNKKTPNNHEIFKNVVVCFVCVCVCEAMIVQKTIVLKKYW